MKLTGNSCHGRIHTMINKIRKNICIVCKKEFFKNGKNHFYCTRGCRRKAREILECGNELEFNQLTANRKECFPKKTKERKRNTLKYL